MKYSSGLFAALIFCVIWYIGNYWYFWVTHSKSTILNVKNISTKNNDKYQLGINHFFRIRNNKNIYENILKISLRTSQLQVTVHNRLIVHHFHTGINSTREELRKLIEEKDCAIPSIVHFVFPVSDVTFTHYISMLSAVWMNRPHATVIWYYRMPAGFYWDLFTKNVSSATFTQLVMIRRDIPKSVYGNGVTNLAHFSDIMRYEALMIFGGIYLDLDVFVLKDMRPLRRKYQTIVIPDEGDYGLNNGVLLSPPNDLFLKLWHLTYQTFNSKIWREHSIELPRTLANAFPHLLHIEKNTLAEPTWNKWKTIYSKTRSWDWKTINYSVHLWYRAYGVRHNMTSIKCVDNMFGDMSRYILFGNSTLNTANCAD